MSARSPRTTLTAASALLAALLAALCAGGCEQEPVPSAPLMPADARWVQPLLERVGDPFPRRFANLAGEAYVIEVPPQRIASGTLFTDAVLLAICPEDRIAALHEVSTKPMFSPVATESRAFPRHLTPDPESFMAVDPDLVFLASFSDKRMLRLVSAKGRPVIRLQQFRRITGVQNSIRAVGYITGLDRAAEELVQKMQARLDALAKGRERRRAWRLISWADGFAAGGDTIFDDILKSVGATNLAAENGIRGHKQIGVERVLALNPDALVIGVLPGQEQQAREKLQRLNGMKMLGAVQRDRIVFVPNSLLLSTTHHLAGAAEVIAKTLDAWGKP